jgi:hypothetical protein
VRDGKLETAVLWAAQQEYDGGTYQGTPPGVVTLYNARYYSDGSAHDCSYFTAFTGKGCREYTGRPLMCDGERMSCNTRREHIQSCQPGHEDIHQLLPKHGRVVTISQVLGDTFYHFLAEDLTRTMPLLDEILADETILVHVFNSGANFAVDALQLIGIPRERLIEGDGCARILYIPEPVGCGGPSFEMLHMTRRRLRAALGCPVHRMDGSKYVVMIRRQDTRKVDNHQDVRAAVESSLRALPNEVSELQACP